MATNPIRMCKLLVGLPDINVLGVTHPVAGPVRVGGLHDDRQLTSPALLGMRKCSFGLEVAGQIASATGPLARAGGHVRNRKRGRPRGGRDRGLVAGRACGRRPRRKATSPPGWVYEPVAAGIGRVERSGALSAGLPSRASDTTDRFARRVVTTSVLWALAQRPIAAHADRSFLTIVKAREERDGRRNRYQIQKHLPLREALSRERTHRQGAKPPGRRQHTHRRNVADSGREGPKPSPSPGPKRSSMSRDRAAAAVATHSRRRCGEGDRTPGADHEGAAPQGRFRSGDSDIGQV